MLYTFRFNTKKRVIFLSTILIFMTSVAQDVDPEDILQQAYQDFLSNKYEQAHEKYLWFWENASKIKPELHGVRLSFALHEWIEVGRHYPLALQKIKKIRDEKSKSIENGNYDGMLFMDVTAINKRLQEGIKTIDLYKKIYVSNKRFCWLVFDTALEDLVEFGEYELANEFMKDPVKWIDMRIDTFKLMKSNFKSRDIPQMTKSVLEGTHEELFQKYYMLISKLLIKNNRVVELNLVNERIKEKLGSDFFKLLKTDSE